MLALSAASCSSTAILNSLFPNPAFANLSLRALTSSPYSVIAFLTSDITSEVSISARSSEASAAFFITSICVSNSFDKSLIAADCFTQASLTSLVLSASISALSSAVFDIDVSILARSLICFNSSFVCLFISSRRNFKASL